MCLKNLLETTVWSHHFTTSYLHTIRKISNQTAHLDLPLLSEACLHVVQLHINLLVTCVPTLLSQPTLCTLQKLFVLRAVIYLSLKPRNYPDPFYSYTANQCFLSYVWNHTVISTGLQTLQICTFKRWHTDGANTLKWLLADVSTPLENIASYTAFD